MYNTRYLVTQKPSKEKVKLGWVWHPQISTTAVIKCIQWRLQCLIMKHDLPCERLSLLKAYKIVRSYHVKGFQHPVRSRDYFSSESLSFSDLISWVDHHLVNSACNIGQPCCRIFIRFGSNAHGSRSLVMTWLVKNIDLIANVI